MLWNGVMGMLGVGTAEKVIKVVTRPNAVVAEACVSMVWLGGSLACL